VAAVHYRAAAWRGAALGWLVADRGLKGIASTVRSAAGRAWQGIKEAFN